MDRTTQLRQQTAAKVATFSVGDIINFCVYDDTGCDNPGSSGDPVDVPLTGKILSITGNFARVEHKYGIAIAWLPIATKMEVSNANVDS